MSDLPLGEGETVEVIRSGLPAAQDHTMASALVRAEIDTQIATAKHYPRSIQRAISQILTLATLDEETATECIYALKRSGKPVRGPSIRLAEIIASQWGNCRDNAFVAAIDRTNKLIVAEGSFYDLETNRETRGSVQRRISNKDGKIFSDDMIIVTGNAACAIARRNAILGGVPKGVWRKAVEACERIIRGDAVTLVERRDAAISALAHFNLNPDQIFKIMDVKGIEDLDLDDIATLRVIYTSLRNGEQTVEELLRNIEPEKPARAPVTATISAPAAFTATVPNAHAAEESVAAPQPAQACGGDLDEVPQISVSSAASSDPSPTPEPAQAAAGLPAAQPVLFDAETGELPDDTAIIANDIIARLDKAAGDAKAVFRIVQETKEDFERLPSAQQGRVRDALIRANKTKRKAA